MGSRAMGRSQHFAVARDPRRCRSGWLARDILHCRGQAEDRGRDTGTHSDSYRVLLYLVAIAAPWTVWPLWLALLTTAIVLIALASGLRRAHWLLKGAPSVSDLPAS